MVASKTDMTDFSIAAFAFSKRESNSGFYIAFGFSYFFSSYF